MSNKKIVLSVITPVYNRKDCIEKCIKNFISQNCSRAEHIIIDGLSTDGTAEIIKKYAKIYPHIKWVSEKDKGQANAINKGIKIARGSIVSSLNSDDFYEPGVFNKVLKIFKKLPTDSFLFGNVKVWEENKNRELFISKIWKPEFSSYQEMLLKYNSNAHPINPSGYFYHKSLHKKAGYYDEKLEYIFDKVFLYKVFPLAKGRYYIDENFGNFLFVKGAKTHNNCMLQTCSDFEKKYDAEFFKNLTEKYLSSAPRFRETARKPKNKIKKIPLMEEGFDYIDLITEKEKNKQLSSRVESIEKSLTWQALSRYQKFVDFLLPRKTFLRKAYDRFILFNQNIVSRNKKANHNSNSDFSGK